MSYEDHIDSMLRSVNARAQCLLIQKTINLRRVKMEGLYEFKHRTKDGRNLFLEEMTDNHLLNTMGLLLDNLDKARAVINGKQASTWKRKTQPSVLSIDDAEEFYIYFKLKFSSYLMEAALRDLDISCIKERLREILERNGKIEVHGISEAKEIGFDEYQQEEDDD